MSTCHCGRCLDAFSKIAYFYEKGDNLYELIELPHYQELPHLRASAIAGCTFCRKLVLEVLGINAWNADCEEKFSSWTTSQNYQIHLQFRLMLPDKPDATLGRYCSIHVNSAVAKNNKVSTEMEDTHNVQLVPVPLTIKGAGDLRGLNIPTSSFVHGVPLQSFVKRIGDSPTWSRDPLPSRITITCALQGAMDAIRRINYPGAALLEAASPTITEQALVNLNSWINDCDCHNETSTSTDLRRPQGPSRLLHVSKLRGTVTVRLVDVATKDLNSLEYICLSYTWGTDAQTIVLNSTTADRLRWGINSKLLPRTIKEACDVVIGVNKSWLWVDALCIYQGADDLADRDWRLESRKMSDIYLRAWMTISAASGSDANSGLFKAPDPTLLVPEYYAHPLHGKEVDWYYHIHSLWDISIADAPVNTRGWVFQERLFSRRTAFFTPIGVAWECPCKVILFDRSFSSFRIGDEVANWANDFVGHKPQLNHKSLFNRYKQSDFMDSLDRSDASRLLTTSSDAKALIEEYWRIVNVYSALLFTRDTDRPSAFQGIARVFSKGRPNGDYLAGLWKSTIFHDLLWRRVDYVNSGNHLRTSSASERLLPGPHWSWLSHEGQVRSCAPRNGSNLARLFNSTTVLEDEANSFGAVESGELEIICPLLYAALEKSGSKYRFLVIPPLDPDDYNIDFDDVGIEQAGFWYLVLLGQYGREKLKTIFSWIPLLREKLKVSKLEPLQFWFDEDSAKLKCFHTLVVLMCELKMTIHDPNSRFHGLIVREVRAGKYERIGVWSAGGSATLLDEVPSQSICLV